MEADPASLYHESIDMEDAWHAQTLLAYQLNGEPLPVKNGAPLRLRVERQLGYKHAKYLMKIELVSSLDGISAPPIWTPCSVSTTIKEERLLSASSGRPRFHKTDIVLPSFQGSISYARLING
jgi:hypothetical protein